MTVVACLVFIYINQPVEVMVTGNLIEDLGSELVVDVSHSVEWYGVNSDQYRKYKVQTEQCSKRKIK